jgi:GNAT superfamily N-acetyltransferase
VVGIRVATRDDIPAMHRVRRSVLENRLADPSSVRERHYHEILDAGGRAWVAEADGPVIGFAVADLARRNVWALFVDAAFEGRGAGRRLHDTMMDWLFDAGADAVWLSTDPGTRAERFYRAAGWRYVGSQPNGEARYELTRADWEGR